MGHQQNQLDHSDYLFIRELILRRSGLHFPEKKQRELELGVLKALQDAPQGISTVKQYFNLLKQENTPLAEIEMARLINILTIGETHFFRDNSQFHALRNHILPTLIARKQAIGPHVFTPQLRVWSAGCATGEEPYSLAILLKELIPDIHKWNVLILATDINQDSLQKAKQAIYSDWSFRETQAKSLRAIYFNKQGKYYHLRDDIKRLVTFTPLNLIEDDFPGLYNNTTTMDLIICRNVTIYFTPEITRKLIDKFYRSLVNGGWLVVGHAEPSLENYRDFESQLVSGTIFYQKSNTSALKTQPIQPFKPPVQHTSQMQQKPFLVPPSIKQQPGQESHLSTAAQSQDDALTDKFYEQAEAWLKQSKPYKVIDELKSHLNEIPLTRQAQSYTLLARAYADIGRWNEAQHWSEEALDINKLLPQPYHILAMVYENQGRFTDAIANLKKVIYLDRNQLLPHFSLAVLYKKQNELVLAKRAINSLVQMLQKYPLETIIPDSGGTTVKRLLYVAEQMQLDLKNK